MKKIIPLLVLVLIGSFADAQGITIFGIHLFGPSSNSSKNKSQEWYRNVITDNDGDGSFGSQTVDSLYQKNSPGGDYSTIRPVFIHVFDCNDNNATVYVKQSFYIDANGDGYGENPANTEMLCSATAPPGYASQLVPEINFHLTNYGPVDTLLWLSTLENAQINGAKYFDILADDFVNKALALKFHGFYWPGGVDANRVNYVAGDTDYLHPVTANGGFNCNFCNEKSLNCCVKMPVSFFPQAVEFCRRLHVPIAMGANVEYYDSTGFIAALNYAKRKVGVLFVTEGQETSNTYANCRICGNGTLYATTITPIVSTQKRIVPHTLRLLDCEQIKSANFKNTFDDATATLTEVDGPRVYFPWQQTMLRFTNLPTDPVLRDQAEKDSIDKAVNSLSTRQGWYKTKYNKPIGITEAAWMGDGFMPFDSTWLDVYGTANYMFKIMDMAKTPNTVLLNLVWKLDNVIPKSGLLDYKYTVTRFFGDYFANDTDQIVWCPPGTNCAASINSDGHGVLLVLNPNNSAINCSGVLVNGFYRPVISIESVSSISINGNITTSLTTNDPAFSFSEIIF